MQSHIKAGLIISGVTIVISEILLMVNPAGDSPSRWLVFLIFVGFLIYFQTEFAKSKDHYVSFGNVFSYGFKITAVVTCISILYLLVFPYIHPEFKEKSIQIAREEMEKNEKIQESQIDNAMEIMNKFFWVFAIGGSLLTNLIMGCIGSLIGAAVTKKKGVNPFNEEQPINS